MEEYYLKQKGSVEKMKELGAQIKFYPEMHQQILMNWLDSIKNRLANFSATILWDRDSNLVL